MPRLLAISTSTAASFSRLHSRLGLIGACWQEIKRRRLVNDSNCIKLSICSGCGEFGRCIKPKTLEAAVGRSV